MAEKINLFKSPSISFLINILHYIGVINNYHGEINKKSYKYILFEIYATIVHWIMSLYLLLHLLSTLKRSSRNFSEFSQSVMEDLHFQLLYIYFQFYRRNTVLMREVDTLLKSFSTADKTIMEKCNLKAKKCSILTLTCMIMTFSGIILEKYFVLSNALSDMRKSVYEVDNPKRKLPIKFYIPFMNESQSYYYEILFTIEIYVVMILFNISTCVVGTLLPILIIHLEGQYNILCKYTEKIGKRHYDSNKYEIVYTNIENNEYVLIGSLKSRFKRNQSISKGTIHPARVSRSVNCEIEDDILSTTRNKEFRNVRETSLNHLTTTKSNIVKARDQIVLNMQNEATLRDYDKRYLRQIIQFHQKLLHFQDKVSTDLSFKARSTVTYLLNCQQCFVPW